MHEPTPMEVRLDAAWRGRFVAAGEKPVAEKAWALAFRAQRYHAGLEDSVPPVEAFGAFASEDEEQRSAGLLGLTFVARAHLLSFDREGFDDALAAMSNLAIDGLSPRAELYHRVTQGWMAHLDGVRPQDLDALEVLAGDSSRARLGELVIETNVLRALAMLNLGELGEATVIARRVSRMARAEAMPQQEYLAHVCLALVRRREGHVHLAMRILSSLRKVAPPVWDPLLDWQLRLAGQTQQSVGPALHLSELVTSSIDGDGGRHAAAQARLEESVRGFTEDERESALVSGALDPRAPAAELREELLSWATGEDDRLPHGLHSVVAGIGSPHTDLAGHSWVYASPETPARRFLHPGIGLVSEVRRCEGTRRRHGRTELATAVLVLAGAEGIPLSKFVPRVYGFPYSAQAHDGVLRVLLHRMRKNLDGSATIVRHDDRLTLSVLAPFIVPDPRTSEPSSEHILRAIAANPGTSAKAIAKALGVPLRTVQAALSTLVAGGVCMAERVGAAVEYHLEDTTFSEPTTFHGVAGAEGAS